MPIDYTWFINFLRLANTDTTQELNIPPFEDKGDLEYSVTNILAKTLRDSEETETFSD